MWKSASGENEVQRLRRQIAKQQRALALNELPYIRIPAILSETGSATAYTAEMDYVYYLDPVSFFAAASVTDLSKVAGMLLGFLDASLSASPLSVVPSLVFLDKLDQVERALEEAGSLDRYRPHIDRVRSTAGGAPTMEIPLGTCHGDLTMSNILFAPDAESLALIDFLDSFVDSPLVDIAKLRQDTMFHWTMLMSHEPVDFVRFRQTMAYLDQRIVRHYSPHRWFTDHIELMSAVNLLRIAPYATSDAIHDFLISSLQRLRT